MSAFYTVTKERYHCVYNSSLALFLLLKSDWKWGSMCMYVDNQHGEMMIF